MNKLYWDIDDFTYESNWILVQDSKERIFFADEGIFEYYTSKYEDNKTDILIIIYE